MLCSECKSRPLYDIRQDRSIQRHYSTTSYDVIETRFHSYCVIPLSVARYTSNTTSFRASDASGCSVLAGIFLFLPEALCFSVSYEGQVPRVLPNELLLRATV